MPRSAQVRPPAGGFTHDVHVDRSGIAWVTGEDGTFGYDARDADPLTPTLVYRSDENVTNTGNSGPSTDPGTANDSRSTSCTTTRCAPTSPWADDGTRQASSPGPGDAGNVLAVTEEDYLRPGCEGQGSLQTWRITGEHNADGTIKLELLDLWTTELNELMHGTGRSNRSPADTVNCSAHWFDVSGSSSPRAGTTRASASWTSPTRTTSGRWATTSTRASSGPRTSRPATPARQVVYALDAAGGIDVLKHRPLRRRRPRGPRPRARDRPRRHPHSAPDLPLRLPARSATGHLARVAERDGLCEGVEEVGDHVVGPLVDLPLAVAACDESVSA